MSNGWRLVSAKRETRKINADTGMRKMNHMPPQNPGRLWYSTTRPRLMLPSVSGALIHRKTGMTDSAIDSSYEISCAEARTPPRKGYFEFEAQPARISE